MLIRERPFRALRTLIRNRSQVESWIADAPDPLRRPACAPSPSLVRGGVMTTRDAVTLLTYPIALLWLVALTVLLWRGGKKVVTARAENAHRDRDAGIPVSR
jgi:hypothetical protein